MTDDKKFLIAGLGNIGQEYAGTRHNYGFEVAFALAKNLNAEFKRERFGYVARASYKGRKFIILMPDTYMNLSGNAVKFWLRNENIAPENCMVVLDDIDLPVGSFKIKPKGGGGTHNGICNIIEQLGHGNFPRMRCGIGKNYAQGFQVDYVLGKFTSEELKLVDECIPKAVEALKSFATAGLQRTMNLYNTVEKESTSQQQ